MLLAVALASFGCAHVQQVADRALTSLSLKDPCPDAVDGRAAGAATADAAVSCFEQAVRERKSELLLRVTCRGRGPTSCLQTTASTREADAAVRTLSKGTWNDALGRWKDGDDAYVYAVDTHPQEARVSTVTVRKIVDGDRWAVTDVGELGRDAAERKMKGR